MANKLLDFEQALTFVRNVYENRKTTSRSELQRAINIIDLITEELSDKQGWIEEELRELEQRHSQ